MNNKRWILLFQKNSIYVTYAMQCYVRGCQMLFFNSPVLLTGHKDVSLVTRWFTTCATNLTERFLSSGISYLTLLPTFWDSSGTSILTSKSAGLHAAVWNTVPTQQLFWITQQSINLIFNVRFIKNALINYLWQTV